MAKGEIVADGEGIRTCMEKLLSEENDWDQIVIIIIIINSLY